MIELPPWLEEKIEKEFKCPNCDGEMSTEFVTAFGLKDSSKHPGTIVCWMEYNCLICDKKSHIEIRPYSTHQLCEDMEMKDSKTKKSKKRRRQNVEVIKSKIREEEVKEAKIILESSKTWYDIMLGFGLNADGIKNYMKEGENMDIDNK